MVTRVFIIKSKESSETIIAKFREMIDALELSIIEKATKWFKTPEGQKTYHIWAPGVVNFNVDIKYQPIGRRNIARIECQSLKEEILNDFTKKLEKEIKHYFGEAFSEEPQKISIYFVEKVSSTNVRAYEVLYIIENGLRVFIMITLHASIGNDWWEKGVSNKVRDRCKERKEKERKIKWLTGHVPHEMFYSNFGDIAAILRRASNQPYFQKRISSIDGIDVWQGKLKECEVLRNRLAHNRSISDDDLQRLTLFAQDLQKVLTP